MILTTRKNQPAKVASISEICACFNQKRDAFYKYLNRRLGKTLIKKDVVQLVKRERKSQPRIGTRKLLVTLKPDLESAGIKIGRDALFDVLRENSMLVKSKRSYCKTTNSHHHFHKYKNLVKDLSISRPNRIWVSDITCIRTIKGFCYLALVSDLYSRKILGYDISDSLELAGCLRAFKRARRTARPGPNLIHHSDRGFQYCSNQYVNELLKHKIQISMTEENHCYENCVAERINGILKDEFFLDECFTSTQHAKIAAKNAINIYNSKRLHLSLDLKTPNEIFFDAA